MISVICVYNNKAMLDRILLPSLKEQTVEYEFISVDNTNGIFKSAASALNFGGKMAIGKYILFVHQDVELGSATWLLDVEKLLDSLPDLGMAGSVGMSTKGNTWLDGGKGYIMNLGEVLGKPHNVPIEVNTLDECVLIVPRKVFEVLRFDDKNFTGWHCYGCDYCLSAQEMGLKVYVIPAFIYHRSIAVNSKDLLKYQTRLYMKHRKAFPRISTTTGILTGARLIVALSVAVMVWVFKRIYWEKLRRTWIQVAASELKDCETVLDVGCGSNSQLQHCNVSYSLGVDIFDSYLEESRKKGLLTEYMKADIRTVSFKPQSFDAVFCSEVLEHMTKEEGIALLQNMSLWAKKKVIITTPNGYIPQTEYDNNPFQNHVSGWTASDLRRAGYKVRGINSWKFLRGERGIVKLRPIFFWSMIGEATGLIPTYLPWFAFQLLAIKKVAHE